MKISAMVLEQRRQPKKSWFGKEHTPWNKGLKTGLIPKSAYKQGRKETEEERQKRIALIPKREKHPNWKGGKLIYRKIAFNDIGKEPICEICGSKKRVNIHHRDKNRCNNKPNNLMVLCSKCHIGKVHYQDIYNSIKRGKESPNYKHGRYCKCPQ